MMYQRTLAVVAGLGMMFACAAARGQERVEQVSQHGITWTFAEPVQAGQFVTGDWWVVGPVTVQSVSPAPGPDDPDSHIETPLNRWGDTSLRNDPTMRNGSMIVLAAGRKQGYDSRSATYDAELSLSFPLTIEPDRSLISTISNPTVPVDNFAHKILWTSEKKSQTVLKTAAVLTVLREPPPADAFRPTYIGTEKKIYRLSQIRWDLLKNLPAPKIDEAEYTPAYHLRLPNDWGQMERYFERPWLEHLSDWPQQQLNPNENQPNYGREHGRLVSMASLMLHLDVPREQKQKLLIGLVQYGIDNAGVANNGGNWNWGGGHTSGRKWPILFASLMLDAPELREFPENFAFHEDAQTYYGTGWAGQTALYWMVQHHGKRERFEEKPPEQWDRWDQSSESYRVNTNAVAWVGMALSARLMGAIQIWDHDAFFDYCDRWMEQEDRYAANRGPHARPKQEGKTFDPFTNAMWHAYRASAPDQPMAGNPRMFVWEGRGYKWVPNPRPDEKTVAEHVAKIQAERK